ncbi:MAG: hypothetical protein HY290_06190, partial [Planctomycetia bacterium]|nr:hypothetical protein [Planctomycetia bacterium]
MKIDSVTSSGIFTNTVTGVATDPSDVTIVTAGALNIAAAITTGAADAGIVRLQAAGDITQTAAGTITGGTLGVYNTAGNTTLDQDNVVGTVGTPGVFAAETTTAGKSITFKDTTTGELQVGQVTSSGIFTNTVTGVLTNKGDITVATGGALTLNQAVSTSAGDSKTVRLQANGDVTQAAAGIITAGTLGVYDTAGNITLDQSNVVGTAGTPGVFAAETTTAGKSITFKDSTTGELQIGQVTSSGIFTNTVTGVLTNKGDITVATGGALTLNKAVSTSAGDSKTVRLQANGDITQAAAGIVTAGTLGVYDTAGNITLDQANVVGTAGTAGTFAAQDTDSATPGAIVFKDTTTGELKIGAVASSGVFTNTVTGVQTDKGDITLSTGGKLTINEVIKDTNATLTATIRLQANGDVSQASTAVITGKNLGVNTAVGDIDLCAAPNKVNGTFGATATTGSVGFRDSVTFTLGAVTAVAGLFNGANGITAAAAGDITLVSDTTLDVNKALTTTGTIRLHAAGNVTQSAAITAGSLSAFTSSGDITLNNAGNSVSTFAAEDTDSVTPGNVSFFDSIATALTISTVLADAGGCATTVTGATTNKGDITIVTGGKLTLNQAVSTGAGDVGTVRLQAAGDITQAAAGIITGLNLGVYNTSGIINLNQSNVIGTAGTAGTFAAQNTDSATPGAVVFNDTTTGELKIGSVASSGKFTNTVTGVVTDKGDMTLATAGKLTLNQAVSTGAGDVGTVRLQAAGNITQAAIGIITAGTLGVYDTAGDITLDQANVVGTALTTGIFAAQDT